MAGYKKSKIPKLFIPKFSIFTALIKIFESCGCAFLMCTSGNIKGQCIDKVNRMKSIVKSVNPVVCMSNKLNKS